MQVEGLAGGYGRLTVFRDVSLVVERGQTVGLLGPNGAGKTTLLKTIVGALRNSAGRVLLEGEDVTSPTGVSPRARAGLDLVPEGRHILGTLTVHDNLSLTRAIEAHRPGLDPFETRLAEVLRIVSAPAGTRHPDGCIAERRRAADAGDRPCACCSIRRS